MSECCLAGFLWNGSPTGKETTLAGNKAYVTGSNKDVAILIVHDVFGWTLTNLRLLADHYAKEANATVYLPDYFGGEIVTPEMLGPPRADVSDAKSLDLGAFMVRNSKEIRFPEISGGAKELKTKLGFKKVGAIGFCYGGWAVFQLGDKRNPLVDCISMAHPSGVTEDEISAVGVPVQILAPETDPQFSPELKAFSNKTIPTLGVAYDYQYFPGLVHGFATRGDVNDPVQKKGLERAKNDAVHWFLTHLH